MRTANVHQTVTSLLLATAVACFGASYHVAKTGNDANAGNLASPFLTISKAAQAAQPGDSVIVHAGEYREWVQPARGGSSEATRITYKAAPSENVTIKGSERITTWIGQGGGVWKVDLDDSFFGTYRPFASTIAGRYTGDYISEGAWCHLGEVFLDGQIYYEKQTLAEVQSAPKSWYTSHSGTTSSIYANFGTGNPNSQLAEINVRESVFGKDVQTGINYITVDGFKMCQSAEEWLPTYTSPNSKAVIFASGANWTIQNCTVWYGKMRGISIDGPNVEGKHIVRNNTIKHCASSGVAGAYAHGSVISGNWISNIGEQRPYFGVEGGGIKIHLCQRITIAGNVIADITHRGWGQGIWLDWPGAGNRITGNVFSNVPTGAWVFLENPSGPNLIDNNIVVGYCHDAGLGDGNVVVNNLLYGVYIFFGTDGWGKVSGKSNRSLNNIFIKGAYAQIPQNAGNVSDYNAFLEWAGKSWDDSHSVVDNSGAGFSAACDSTARTVAVSFTLPNAAAALQCPVVTTNSIGDLSIVNTTGLRMTDPDGSALSIDRDIFQNCRGLSTKVGPFKDVKAGANTFVVRPNSNFDFKAACGAVATSRPAHGRTLPRNDHPRTYYDLRGRLIAYAVSDAMLQGKTARGVYVGASVAGEVLQRTLVVR